MKLQHSIQLTCTYDVTGVLNLLAPTVACYETATFNPSTCLYDVTGSHPAAPTVACYETATFNPTTCTYDVTGISTCCSYCSLL